MLLNPRNSNEALIYPEEIREKAIGLAESFAWFSARTYLWFVLGLLALVSFLVATAGILPATPRSVLSAFGLMSLAVLVPKLMTRRLLITRREEILRIIQSGFNGPDKDHPPLSP